MKVKLLFSLAFILFFISSNIYSCSELAQVQWHQEDPSPNDSFYNIVMTELKKHEPTLEEKNVKFTKGGLSADLVAIGKNTVVRLSTSKYNPLENTKVIGLYQKFIIDEICVHTIGFKLCLPEFIILYTNALNAAPDKKTFSLQVMPKALGNPLNFYLVESNPDCVLGQIFSELGKATAIFQNRFMTRIGDQYFTAAHTDFHGGNIFCQAIPKKNKMITEYSFSLIDCSELELRGIHPVMDIAYLLYHSCYCLYATKRPSDSLQYVTENFYRGYLSHLPQQVSSYLIQLLPEARRISTCELIKTKNLMFLDERNPSIKGFIPYFDHIHRDAVKRTIESLMAPS